MRLTPNPLRRSRATRINAHSGACPNSSFCEQLEPRILLTFNPSADEQYMLELINRFRANPQAELGLLTSSLGTQARSANADVDSALRFFRTNGVILQQQWNSLTSVPPLAWNQNLTDAAEFHTLEMIRQSMQEHQLPGEPDLAQRARNANYTPFRTLGESIFAFARSVDHAHAGFLLDWGDEPNGIQNPPGHRETAINGAFREIGIRIIAENNPSTSVGPLVTTLDFGDRFGLGNSYLLGVVFTDFDNNGAYSPGEGLGDVTIQVRNLGNDFGQVISTTTSLSAGGYQLQVAPGTYNVTFSGGSFGSAVTYRNVAIAGNNIKLDALRGFVPPVPLLEVLGGAPGLEQSIAVGDTSPVHADGTYFGDAELARGFVDRAFYVVNRGTGPLTLSGLRVQISGIDATDFVVLSVPEGTIEPGAQSAFVVRFDPTDRRLRNATVTITSNDVQSPIFAFAIRGRGLELPELQVKGKGRVIANGANAPTTGNLTSFTGVNIISGIKNRTFRLFNLGSADLTITSITIDGESAADFQVRVVSSLIVAPGTAVNLRIRFDPSGPDFRHAQVRILTNDADRSPWTFAIRGFGVPTAAIAILGGQQAASIGADTPPTPSLGTDFGDVRIVNHTRLRTFTIVNDGWAALLLSGSPRITISGPNASEFRLAANTSTSSLAIGERAEFAIRFNPSALSGVGLRTATVQIASNDPRAPIFEFQIVGIAV